MNIKRMIKIILSFLAGFIVLFSCILLFNTFRFKSRQVPVAQVGQPDINEKAIQHLSQTVRYKTISYDEVSQIDPAPFLDFAKFLKTTYPVVDASLERKVINNYSLLYKWQGKNPDLKPVVLVAHYDVVPVDENSLKEWIEEPFSGAIQKGFIWGRGTMDDKQAVTAIMEATELLLKEGFQPERTFYFAFGHDEEIGGFTGSKAIVSFFRQSDVQAEYVLDEGLSITRKVVPGIEKDLALIGISEKGFLTVDLSLNLVGGHASMPQKETAIEIMGRAILNLRENQPPPRICEPVEKFLEYVGPEMPFPQKIVFANRWLFKKVILSLYGKRPAGNVAVRTTTAPTIFKSGHKSNVLPDNATATINFRILPGETTDGIMKHINKVIKDERITITARPLGSEPSPVSSIEHYGFTTIAKTVRENFPDVLVSPSLFVGASDARHYTVLSENVYRFSPQIATTEDLTRFHGVNERISVEGFRNFIRFYYRFIKNNI